MTWRGLLVVSALLAACGGVQQVATTTTTTGPTPTTTTTSTTTTTTTTTTLPPTTTTTKPSVEVPEGYELFDGSIDGYLIALPSRWVVLDLTEAEIEELLAEVEGVLEPEAIDLVRASLATGITYSLFALDVSGDPNMNLIVGRRGPLDNLDDIEAFAPVQIEEVFGGTVLSVDRVEASSSEGLRIVYELPIGEVTVEGHQYYMLTESTVYVVTFTTFDPEPNRDIFATVMSTFTPTGD